MLRTKHEMSDLFHSLFHFVNSDFLSFLWIKSFHEVLRMWDLILFSLYSHFLHETIMKTLKPWTSAQIFSWHSLRSNYIPTSWLSVYEHISVSAIGLCMLPWLCVTLLLPGSIDASILLWPPSPLFNCFLSNCFLNRRPRINAVLYWKAP